MFKNYIINSFIKTVNKNLKKKFSTNFKLLNETCIYAIASGTNQRCGLAVVRLSGKNSIKILSILTKTNEFEARKIYLKSLIHPVTSDKIDRGLVVCFKGVYYSFYKSIKLVLIF